jgi:hypothetical protein
MFPYTPIKQKPDAEGIRFLLYRRSSSFKSLLFLYADQLNIKYQRAVR